MDVVEGWCSLHPGMLWRGGCSLHPLLLLFVSQPHGVSAMPTGAEDDDDDVDVVGVDGDDEGVTYYYYCDYLFTLLLGNHSAGTRADRKELRSSKAEPGGGPRGRRGACGSGTNEGSEMPRGKHGARCGR